MERLSEDGSSAKTQINVKLTEQDSILVERFRSESVTRGWGFKQAVLDALEKWLENPPQQPTTPMDSLRVVVARLEVIETKLLEVNKPESLSPTTRSTVEQLRERTSNQSQAIARLQQEVSVLKEQASGLEGASLQLVKDTLGHSSILISERYLHAKPDDSSAMYLPE